MVNEKRLFYTLIKDRILIDIADFIAVRLEQENKYFIVKCRYETDNVSPTYGDIISKEDFKLLNYQASRQVILSDRYLGDIVRSN